MDSTNQEKEDALTQTQLRILEIGKREFLKKGFKDASLRAIVKEAGFTQGAFYGYYKSKEELFDALVSPVAETLVEQFKQAQEAHFDLIPKGQTASSRSLTTEYLIYFLNYVYDNFDVFKLIVCCSAGTRYEHFIHELVELEVSRTEEYYAKLAELGKIEGSVSHKLHHLLTSAYFAAVFETVEHDMPRNEAISYAKELATFFNCGWEGLIAFK